MPEATIAAGTQKGSDMPIPKASVRPRLHRLAALPRALAAAVVLTAVVASAPAPAGAARPETRTSSGLGVACAAAHDGGTVLVQATGGGDGTGFVGVWAPGTQPGVDRAALVSDEMPTTFDGTTLSAAGTLYDVETGDPAGDTSFALVLAFDEGTRIRERERTGNRVTRVTGVQRLVSGTGVVAVVDRKVAVEECSGTSSEVTSFTTNPNSIIGSGDSVMVNCQVTNGEGYLADLYGNNINVFLDVYGPDSELLFDGFVHRDDGTAITDQGLEGPIRVHDSRTGEYAGDTTGSLGATSVGAVHRIEQAFQDGVVRLKVQDLALSGEIVLPGGLSFSFDDCLAASIASRLRVTFPRVPDSRRPAPAHDTPDRAQRLSAGRTARTNTVSAAPSAEAAASCLDDEVRHDPAGTLGHTVWYSFTGTGHDVTIDTAGSDFDTALVVYRQTPDGLVEVGCAGDRFVHPYVPIPQAHLTLGTIAGQTYLVQAGGAFGEHGQLRITLS